MFYLTYMWAELRRRRGRTILTALGLAVGVGLVVVVSALSAGLDDAQDEILEPLTGVGTDMSVTRPVRVSGDGEQFTPGGGPGIARLGEGERRQLERENGGARVRLPTGEPGERFERDELISTSQLSFSARQAQRAARVDGVNDVATSLTLSSIHVEGRIPEQEGPVIGGGPGAGPPRDLDFNSFSVTGVDTAKAELAPVTPGQVTSGRWFAADARREAVVNIAYARREGISIGETVTVGGRKFEVVGLSQPPLGGESSDVYVPLGQLQAVSDREGRVNEMHVRASDSAAVDDVAGTIKRGIPGAEVTTAADLADRVGGSLDDARSLADSLGTALIAIGLGAAFLIASLLTLASVNKRVRELGTLKAVGWPQRLVVRQVAGESLAQGVLGGLLGAAVGIAGAAVVSAVGPTLEATIAGEASPLPGPFGQGQVTSAATDVALDAPVDPALIALAIGLAVLGGLIAGAVGGLRAARLRPAEALRSVE